MEVCYPRPPDDIVQETLKQGLDVTIRAKESGNEYTWYPDYSCVCDIGDYAFLVWKPRPSFEMILSSIPQGNSWRLYSDGSISLKDKEDRVYNWSSLNEYVTIHGEVIEEEDEPDYLYYDRDYSN